MNIKITQPPIFEQPPVIKQIKSERSLHSDEVVEGAKTSDRPITLGF